ncbi:hypothetical protein AB2B38_001785 [Balneola sp. MJW-20]|uniref:hypothetical protein n=1 Tax=Gracilimonas aurantiaca TaxID=3234185 RepID=UPI0034668D97
MKKLTTLLFAIAFFSGMTLAQNNTSTVTQSGQDHETTIEQVGTLNYANVDQSGNGQGNSNGNKTDLTQVSDAGSSTAYITQERVNNDVFLYQEGFNTADIQQTNTSSLIRNFTNTGAATQISLGALNTLEVDQAGTNSKLYIDQLVGGNTAIVTQGTAPGYIGNLRNRAWILQDSEGNSVELLQVEALNDATIKQYDGGLHLAEIDQLGNRNTTLLTQNGMSNSAFVTQSGAYDTATITQSGMGNTSTVTQSN